MKFSRSQLLLLISGIAALLFIPGLGAVHLFDWDEINFAEISREMILLGDYSRVHVNFEPFWEKPPLFFWMQVVGMKLFGVGEFAARLPNALCGIVTLTLLIRIGEKLHSLTFGALWALAYAGSILPHLYFRSGIIDPWFNLFIFLGLYHFVLAHWTKNEGFQFSRKQSANHHALIGGGILGLAMLTKGQVALMLFIMVVGVYWLLQFYPTMKRTDPWKLLRGWSKPLTLFLASTLVFTVAWFGYETWKNGPWFMTEFLRYQYRLFSTPDAGHAGFPGYHFVVLLIGCFPASIFMIQEMLQATKGRPYENDMRRWMLILFWVVLILFTIVKSKIVHYSSMAYFPLTYLAALQLNRIWMNRESFGWSRLVTGAIGSLIALVFIIAPFIGKNIEMIRPLVASDPFALGNLSADVNWSGFESMAGFLLLGSLVVAHFMHGSGQFRKSLLTVFMAVAIFIPVTLYFFINKVEGYSQRAAIEFYEARQGEDCYTIPEGYKSYAHLFYSRKVAPGVDGQPDKEAMLRGKVDRPVYVVTKVHKLEQMDKTVGFEKVGDKNGFVFFKKDPKD